MALGAGFLIGNLVAVALGTLFALDPVDGGGSPAA